MSKMVSSWYQLKLRLMSESEQMSPGSTQAIQATPTALLGKTKLGRQHL